MTTAASQIVVGVLSGVGIGLAVFAGFVAVVVAVATIGRHGKVQVVRGRHAIAEHRATPQIEADMAALLADLDEQLELEAAMWR